MKIPFDVYDFFGYLASGFLVLCAAGHAFLGTTLDALDLKAGPATFYVLLAYIIGQIIASPSSFFLEGVIVRRWLRSPEEVLLEEVNEDGRPLHEWFFPGYYERFSGGTRTRVMDAASADRVDERGRDLFRHAYVVARQDNTTLQRLSTFLNQYGFCRNICMGLLISAVLLIVGALMDFHHWTPIDTRKLEWAVLALVASVGMFYRFLKFFRLYTVEVFLSFAARRQAPPAQDQA
jgi:hypothetical protein